MSESRDQLSDRIGRQPAEDFQLGDRVRAVKDGPTGIVDSNHNGWTVVDYGKSKMPYQHGRDKLFAVGSTLRDQGDGLDIIARDEDAYREIQRLGKALDERITECERLRAEWRKADDGWIACRRQLEGAVEALRPWLVHRHFCTDPGRCVCGLADAIAAAGGR